MSAQQMNKKVIIDGKDHVVGKLAAFIAKKLLEGYEITVVCTEKLKFTGPLHRQLGKYESYQKKRCLYNPARGPFHQKEPSKHFTKIVRGMIPRKTIRGTRALNNLTCYEGIPKNMEGVERMIVPNALIQVTADINRASCCLGEVLSRHGWAYSELTDRLTSNLREREAEVQNKKSSGKDKASKLMMNESFKAEVQEKMKAFA